MTRIVNFAHGSFYMLGAYVAYTLTDALVRRAARLLGRHRRGGARRSAAVGALIEMTLLRRIYRAPELFQLLATFGVVLIVAGPRRRRSGGRRTCSVRARRACAAPSTSSASRLPTYELFLIVLGPLVLGLLWLLFNRTRWGVLVRAATQDREMVGGARRQPEMAVHAASSPSAPCLAGLGGALQIPREAVNLHMDLRIIVEVFVVVVIGGLGSVPGAFLAAVLVSASSTPSAS